MTGPQKDDVLTGFVTHVEKKKVVRINAGEKISHPSPFLDLPDIKICKSFEMNKKVKHHTIRTFLNHEMGQIRDQTDITKALISKLKGQFSSFTQE